MGLRINRFDRFDLQNSIGEDIPAFTIWFQGCTAGCEGCQNPTLQPMHNGHDTSVWDIVKVISDQSIKYESVVLLGGEPMEQNIEVLIDLIAVLVSRKYKVWLYTGWELEEIPQRILDMVHFLKTGKYDESLRTEGFPASSNQKIYTNVYGRNLKRIDSMEEMILCK